MCSASIILLILVWVLFHASKPFGVTQTEMEMNSLLNISYPVKRYEPNIGRTGINCTDFGSLCTPCGVPCDGMFCSNHVCSLACLDDQYSNRTGNFYTELSDENQDYTTDFSRCHQTWHNHSLTLNPTSTEKKHLYTAIGGFAALLNVRFDIILLCLFHDFSCCLSGKFWEHKLHNLKETLVCLCLEFILLASGHTKRGINGKANRKARLT